MCLNFLVSAVQRKSNCCCCCCRRRRRRRRRLFFSSLILEVFEVIEGPPGRWTLIHTDSDPGDVGPASSWILWARGFR